MCELFGFTSESEQDIRAYLTEFYSHSVRHPHGWGIATFQNAKAEVLTEPVCANESETAARIVHEMPPVNLLLAHIRLATVGNVESDNCHPFVKTDDSERQWVLIHNGTVWGGMELLKYSAIQDGTTDSERILMYFIDQINERTKQSGAPLNAYERFKTIEKAIFRITRRNKINLIFHDGELLYVHTNMKDTLYYKKQNGSYVFATVPLDNEKWENMPMCTLKAYKNGHLVYTGVNHHNEYIESIKYISSDTNFNL